MYILDSILKNVQGNYIKQFEQQMPQVFEIAFQNSKDDGQRKALIKLFKVWEFFLNKKLLAQISLALNISQHVEDPLLCNHMMLQETRLFDQNDHEKIANFKRVFIPYNLPEEVFENGLYRLGEDVSNDQFQYEQRKQAKASGAQQHFVSKENGGHRAPDYAAGYQVNSGAGMQQQQQPQYLQGAGSSAQSMQPAL